MSWSIPQVRRELMGDLEIDGRFVNPKPCFCPALALLRLDLGFTQQDVKRGLGVSIREYEAGCGLPRLATLLLILEGFGSELVGFQQALQRIRR